MWRYMPLVSGQKVYALGGPVWAKISTIDHLSLHMVTVVLRPTLSRSHSLILVLVYLCRLCLNRLCLCRLGLDRLGVPSLEVSTSYECTGLLATRRLLLSGPRLLGELSHLIRLCLPLRLWLKQQSGRVWQELFNGSLLSWWVVCRACCFLIRDLDCLLDIKFRLLRNTCWWSPGALWCHLNQTLQLWIDSIDHSTPCKPVLIVTDTSDQARLGLELLGFGISQDVVGDYSAVFLESDEHFTTGAVRLCLASLWELTEYVFIHLDWFILTSWQWVGTVEVGDPWGGVGRATRHRSSVNIPVGSHNFWDVQKVPSWGGAFFFWVSL